MMPLLNRLKSFCSKQDGVPKPDKVNEDTEPNSGWMPLALGTPVLFGFIALSLTLFASIETLAQRSQAQHGLVLSASYDDIPQYAMISYLYGPNLIGVLYGLIWYWIDLSIKRMQPWFELSKPSGATAQNSILVDYPSDFVAVAPFQAAKRKHWAVFFSGTALILIVWALTPLQTALLGVNVVARNQSAVIIARSQFMTPSQQTIRRRLLTKAYSTGALKQPYPPFTTANYALLPFYINNKSILPGAEMNWTSQTTKVWSQFSCSPIEYNITNTIRGTTGLLSSNYTFYGENNCTKTNTYNGLPPDLTTSPSSDLLKDDLYVQYFACSNNTNKPHDAIILWAKNFKQQASENDTEWKMNMTANYCKLSYHKQIVTATVTSDNQYPIEGAIEPLSEQQDLSLNEFDYTKLLALFNLGFLYKNSTGDFSYTDNALDYEDSTDPMLDYLFNNWNLSSESGGLPYYALALGDSDATSDDYSDPSRLADIFQRAHQQIFALSVTDLLLNKTTHANDTATATSYMTGIIVSRSLSAILETMLLLVVTMVAAAFYFIKASPCSLLEDPSSISRLLDIGHASPEVIDLFHGLDTATEKEIEQHFEGMVFKLTKDPLSKEVQLIVLQNDQPPDSLPSKTDPNSYIPLTPWVLKRRSGISFLVIMIAAIIALSILKDREIKSNGLLRPSESFEVLLILENYIPTAFATLIEPLWIYLTRTMCIFQPFHDLWKGCSRSTSMEAIYTSLPPQLVLFRAIKSRHITLVLLCFISLLANLLAIGLGALFNEQPIEAKYPQEFLPISQAQFNYSAIYGQEEYWVQKIQMYTPTYQNFIALANLSYNSPLPPWVSAEWYFLPHSLPENAPDDEYLVNTRGYGLSSNCTSMPTCSLSLNHVTLKNDTRGNQMRINYTSTDTTGTYHLEYDTATNSTSEDNSACSAASELIGSSLPGWLSSTIDQSAQLVYANPRTIGFLRRSSNSSENDTVNASFITCDKSFETAMFAVKVDRNGQVLGYSRSSDIESTVEHVNPDPKGNISIFDGLWGPLISSNKWSYNNRTQDWLSQFILLETRSRRFFDPTAPPPDTSNLAPYIKRINRLLFSSYLSTNPQFFLQLDKSSPPATGARIVKETRIFMDNIAFTISICILFINLVVISLFYIRPIRYILPRMPTTIGSILAYLAPSRAIRDGKLSFGWKDKTFSFGRYTGYDGLSHIGIEIDPHVLQKDLSLGLHQTLLGKKASGGK